MEKLSVVSAGTEAASSNRGSNSGGLSGGSDVYTGPTALILVCVLATFYVCGTSPPDGRQVH